jgi:regulator of sigma E protease
MVTVMETLLAMVIRILEFVVALGVIIFLHELGHYLFTRLFKIEVEEFGFGLPPRMLRLFKLGGTEFTLNWIPFGAFVRPKGESDPDVPDGMSAASPVKRLLILLGGPLFNLVTAVILFATVFSLSAAPLRGLVSIVEVVPGSPAEQAGILPEDYIVAVEGQRITDSSQLSNIINANRGVEIDLTYRRAGQETTVKATPRVNPPEGQGSLGITMGAAAVRVNWLEAVPYAAYEVYYQAKALVSLPGMLIRGEIPAEQARMVGPVGMENIFNRMRVEDRNAEETNPSGVPLLTLNFLAVISAALGITNLLPIPALDGGRILFVLPELITRKRIPARYENMINLIGFATLILLMVVITAQDIINPIQLR